MNLFHDTIDLDIAIDPSTRLPLLTEEQKILDLVTNYLPLPYSVAEYGCGKKCSMIIHKLFNLGIPLYAIKRGMIMEKDMSDKALLERDYRNRKHSLTIENSLYHKIDFNSKILLKLLNEAGIKPDAEKSIIKAGEFELSNEKTLQFVEARSHVFAILLLWDEKNQVVKERVVDPTIDSDEIFLVTQLRKYLQASESLIFTAPLMGEFMLDEKYLTEDQVKLYYSILAKRDSKKLSRFEWHDLIRRMNGASKGTIGDPVTWTYANNMAVTDQKHHEFQLYNTGMGNQSSYLIEQMITARENLQEERVIHFIDEIKNQELRLNLSEIVVSDSWWSEKRLEPLINLVNTVSDHIALEELYDRIQSKEPLHLSMTYHRGVGMNRLFGISFRIRELLEELANVSRNDQGQIDALALSPLYTKALKYCIGQMNKAGMQVFIDKVGNVHGLFVDEKTINEVKDSPEKLKELSKKALVFCSHIDTVSDGGKYDGRLGVVTGIETVHLLNDLQRFYGLKYKYPEVNNPLMVSIFIGEEMYFTGMSVSMPGSASVAGFAQVEEVYLMSNQKGELYRDCLSAMLHSLYDYKKKEDVTIVNEEGEEVLDSCFEPTNFFSKHTFERHIEQGSLLHKKRVPLVLVDTIMGIHQQDFFIDGENAELASLLLNVELRKLSMSDAYNKMRVTCGILKHAETSLNDPLEMGYGTRWKLLGMKNHAGSTSYEERKDAGVAIGRLTEFFQQLVKEINKEGIEKLEPIIGAPEFTPGTNRNVIPGEALVTLGFRNSISEVIKNRVMQSCIGFITGTLALDVSNGGEGLIGYKVNEVNYINIATNASLSLDIRFPDTGVKNQYLDKIELLCQELEDKLQVSISPIIEQELDPCHLSTSGQVLQIERSYGGSHNPNETELTRDVLRGSLLQISTAIAFINRKNTENLNLHQMVKDLIPKNWKQTIPVFISGALHDTCNIAKKAALKQD